MVVKCAAEYVFSNPRVCGTGWGGGLLPSTSAGVDVLCPSCLTDQMILVQSGAFLRHHHRFGCSFGPCVDHLRDGIRIWTDRPTDIQKDRQTVGRLELENPHLHRILRGFFYYINNCQPVY